MIYISWNVQNYVCFKCIGYGDINMVSEQQNLTEFAI